MHKRNVGNGFTIIEIMIVMAVAGLIMFIVFLAVPALQRATRNNSQKSDAAFLAAERQNYDINNATNLVQSTVCCDTSVPPLPCAPTGTTSFSIFCGDLDSGFTFYTEPNTWIVGNTKLPVTVSTSGSDYPPLTTESIITENGLICNDSLTGATSTDASLTDAVVLYALERAGGGQNNQCLQTGVTQSGDPTTSP